jgi:hypothetical protein
VGNHPEQGDRVATSASQHHPAGVDNAVATWVGAAVLLAVIIPLRLAVQVQRGTLDWRRERPVLIAAPVMLVLLLVLMVGGPFTLSFGLPLAICGCGAALRIYGVDAPSRVGPLTLRQFGSIAFVVGALGVLIATVRAVTA